MQNYLFFRQLEDCPDKEQATANAGSWAQEENLSYAIFVDIHKKSMTSKKKMREMQFYDKLATFIGTRTSSQCRSHHQKMFDKFKYISKIVETFKMQVGVADYKGKFQEGVEKMKEINRRFSEGENARAAVQTLSEAVPVPPPPEINHAFLLGPTLQQIPFFFNNFYIYGGDYHLPTTEGLQNYYLCP